MFAIQYNHSFILLLLVSSRLCTFYSNTLSHCTEKWFKELCNSAQAHPQYRMNFVTCYSALKSSATFASLKLLDAMNQHPHIQDLMTSVCEINKSVGL